VDEAARVHIQMFGELSVRRTDGSAEITSRVSRSKKLWSLIAYLFTYRVREVPQSELIEFLWPDSEDDGNPASSLKALIHRARGLLDGLGLPGSLIVSGHGAYGIDSSLIASVDTETFDRLCREAQSGADDERLPRLREAFALYRGGFLSVMASEPWVAPINAYFHSLYLRAARDLLALLQKRGCADEIIADCRAAAAIDPYTEELQITLIRALALAGAQDEALQQYASVKKMLMEQFGVSPSTELLDLYREISGGVKSPSPSLDAIRQDLAEKSSADAFYCEYAFFKDFYRVMLRSLSRTGQTANLVMLSVRGADGCALSSRRTRTAMDKLRAVVSGSLRQGDIFTRYGPTQYLLMLPSASYEDSGMVMERVIANFNRVYPGSKLTLQYSRMPLEQFDLEA